MIKRYVPSTDYKSLIDAANKYVKGLDKAGYNYLYYKPFDTLPYNKQYFSDMYEVLNLIEAMRIKSQGRVLEVGSGPGWVTEILAALGYSVCALEPCLDFVEISKQKLESLGQHLHCDITGRVEFCNSTMEDSNLEEDSFDAVLFISSLHHVVDEKACLSKCYKYLKCGGTLGIAEGCYNPDMPHLMAECAEETKRSGVLESPYTQEYLDYILKESGFVNGKRFVCVNGLFPVSQRNLPLPDGSNSNTVIAMKPYLMPTTLDYMVYTKAEITVLNKCLLKDKADITVRIKNVGKTIWLCNSGTGKGYVTIALREGTVGKKDFREALNRINLLMDVAPGEEIEIRAVFTMDNPRDTKIDLINEGYFWFSTK